MACFPLQPVNPLSSALAGALGPNYFPPYNVGFQPTKQKDMIDDKFLQYQTPGGGKIKPVGNTLNKHISQILTPVSGALGAVFNVFAPLFIVLELIRGIIDIICSLINPLPLILTVVELFITIVPPAIALYPPLSSILHGINAAKLIIAIIGSLGAMIIAIIDQIVQCALLLGDLAATGDLTALEAVGLKICSLLEAFANELGGLGPISILLELLEFFFGLGSKLFCPGPEIGTSDCCTAEQCPDIVCFPPSGTGEIVGLTIPFITIGSIIAPIREVDIDSLLGLPFPEDPIEVDFGEISGGLVPLVLGPFQFGPFGLIDLLPIPDFIADFRLLRPNMTLQFTNPPEDILDLNDYIVDPDDIAAPDDGVVPATIRFRVRKLGESPLEVDLGPFGSPGSGATEVTVPATFVGPQPIQVGPGGESVEIPEFLRPPDFAFLYSDAFITGTPVEWEVVPDTIQLITHSLVGLGCCNDVSEAAAGVNALANETAPALAAIGSQATSGFDPVVLKVNGFLPRPPEEELQACFEAQEADPTVSQAQCIFDLVTGYIEEVNEFVERLVCVGASPTASEFEVSRTAVPADNKSFAVIRLQINERGGAPLLPGSLSENFDAEFTTTFGKIGPVILDRAAGEFRASITSDTPGKAEISAAFLVNNIVCTRPQNFDGFALTDKILEVEFVQPGGAFPRKRRGPQYRQSAGGRRR